MLWNIKCVFLLSLQILSEKKILIIRIIPRDIIINVHVPSCKVFVMLVRFQ